MPLLGAPGHGPIHLLVQSADDLGFFWDSDQAGWIRPGLPPLRMLTGPIQHFRGAIWQAWQHKVSTDLCKRKGISGWFWGSIFMVLINYLFLPILGNETKCCFEPFFLVVYGTASCLVRLRKKRFHVGFVVPLIMTVTFFGTVPSLPLLSFAINPSFFHSWVEDRSHWPRCLLWHGWLPGLSPRILGTPWAVASSDLASSCLENALGSYPVSASSAWQPFWDQDDVEDMIDDVPDCS